MVVFWVRGCGRDAKAIKCIGLPMMFVSRKSLGLEDTEMLTEEKDHYVHILMEGESKNSHLSQGIKSLKAMVRLSSQ